MEILSVRYRTFMVGPGVDATMCEMRISERCFANCARCWTRSRN